MTDALNDSPSLRLYLDTIFAESYTQAVKQAQAETSLPLETFPVHCPYGLSQMMDDSFLPT